MKSWIAVLGAIVLTGCGAHGNWVVKVAPTVEVHRAVMKYNEPWDNCRKQPASETRAQFALAKQAKECAEAGSGSEVCTVLAENVRLTQASTAAAVGYGAVAGAGAGITAGLLAGVDPTNPVDMIAGAVIGAIGLAILNDPESSVCIQRHQITYRMLDTGEEITRFLPIQSVHNSEDDGRQLSYMLNNYAPPERLKVGSEVYVLKYLDSRSNESSAFMTQTDLEEYNLRLARLQGSSSAKN